MNKQKQDKKNFWKLCRINLIKLSTISLLNSDGSQLSGGISLDFLNSVSIINEENDKISEFTHGQNENPYTFRESNKNINLKKNHEVLFLLHKLIVEETK